MLGQRENSEKPGGPDDLVNAVTRVAKNLEQIRHNQGLTVTEESQNCLPSGQMRTADSFARFWQAVLIKEQEKKEKEKAFKNLMHQIEELEKRLTEMLQQRAELLQEIEDLKAEEEQIKQELPQTADGRIDWAKIGEKEGIERNNGETDAAYAKRVEEEMRQKAKRGELDPDSALARLFLIQDKISTKTVQLKDLEDDIKVASQSLQDAQTPEDYAAFVESVGPLDERGKDILAGTRANMADAETKLALRKATYEEDSDVQITTQLNEEGASGEARNEEIAITVDTDDIGGLEEDSAAPLQSYEISASKKYGIEDSPIALKTEGVKIAFNIVAVDIKNSATPDSATALDEKFEQDSQKTSPAEQSFTT